MGQDPTGAEQGALCSLLERGYTLTMAARSLRISVPTVNRWIAQGREDLAQLDAEIALGRHPPPPSEFPALGAFVLEVEAAMAVAQGRLVDAVHAAACEGFASGVDGVKPPDWRAAAWLLERVAPEDFREQVQVDHGKAKGDDETAQGLVERLRQAKESRRKREGSEVGGD